MGSMLRFRQETGHDVNSMREDDLAEMITFIWCCVKSACNADKVEFGYSLMDFADSVDPTLVMGFIKDADRDAGESKTDVDPPTS